MKRIFLVIVFFLIASSCSEKTKTYNHQNQQFASELLELKEYFRIPGLAISVEQGGEAIYNDHLGFSDLERQIELDSSVLFPIASITKTFSSVLVMKLVEQGKLSLDEPMISI